MAISPTVEMRQADSATACRDATALQELARLFKPGQLARVYELMQSISRGTGYGSLTIVIAEGRPALFKVEQSFK